MQIILHIGQPKTASTTIQLYCDRNRQNLAAQGVLYPTALGEKKSHIAAFLNGKGRQEHVYGSPDDVVAGLHKEFSGSYNKAIVSDETVFVCKQEKKQKILDLFGGYATSWRILCYVRRPDEHIVSNYQQSIRNNTLGLNVSFEEYYNKLLNGRWYCYNEQMERWADLFGADNVEVRLFHRNTLQSGPVEDFIRWIGLDPATLPPDSEDAANESIDRVGTEILRFLNDCETERSDILHGHTFKSLRHKLRALNSDDRLRLDTERARRLQDRFRKDHERLAQRYLTPEHAAVLLAPPTERSVQPPIASSLVLERLQAVFGDAELARRVSDEIDKRLRDEATSGGASSVYRHRSRPSALPNAF